MAGITTNASIATFGGRLLKASHQSSATGTRMDFNLFLPSGISPASPAPLFIFLSGLSCTPNNAGEKGFLHAHASPLKLAVLFPDTSPRGTNHAGEHDAYDFGSAASFYVDATRRPWSQNYLMESYIARELPDLVFRHFKELDPERVSIGGHSMGGHGALTLYLKNPGRYRSVSAWAPVLNPSQCPWGEKAFRGYLGDDREGWKRHDATELVRKWKGPLNCLIDVGTDDEFYKTRQLLPENFADAVKAAGVEGLNLRYQAGYDHTYYFVSSFAEDHIKHAAKHLGLL